MKILFYDTKKYDRDSFEKVVTDFPETEIDYLEADLSVQTARLAKGYDAVCAFVSSDVSEKVLQILGQRGVKLVLMRCAGFNNVDLAAADANGITVLRVPGYSPEAVAEHAMALALAVNRHIHKGYIKVRENNFSLVGLTGVNFYGKTAGIVGTGKIGAAGLDVVENENGLFYFNHMGDALQNRELAMLRSFPNVIFTPHTAFYTDVNVASMVESAFKAVRAMADGEQTPLEVRL